MDHRRSLFTKMLTTWVLATLFLSGNNLKAQNNTITMVNGDTLFVDACSQRQGFIVDDGGFTANYSNGFDGWVVITFNAGSTLSLNGSYSTESDRDYLRITASNSTTDIFYATGEGSLNVSNTIGRVKLHFHSDWGVVRRGFELSWALTNISGGCPNSINNITASNITSTGATITWNGGFPPYHLIVDGVEMATTNTTSYTFSSLSPSSCHSIIVYSDASQPCCAGHLSFRTLCGSVNLPFNEAFDDLASETFPPCWTSLYNFDDAESQPRLIDLANGIGDNALMISSGNDANTGHFGMICSPTIAASGSWKVKMQLRSSHFDTRIILGTCDTFSDEYALFGFTPVDTFVFDDNNTWYKYQATWSAIPAGRRLAVLMNQGMQDGIGRLAYIDSMAIESCGIDTAYTFHPESDRITVIWNTFGSPTVNVGIRPADGSMSDETTFNDASSPLVITGLDASTEYIITIYPTCGSTPSNPVQLHARTLSSGFNGDRYCLGFFEANEVPEELTIIGAQEVNVGDGRLNVNAWGGRAYIVTERISNLAGKRVAVGFMGYYPQVIVGTMDYPDDPSTFIPLDTIVGDYYRNHFGTCTVPTGSTAGFIALKVSSEFRLNYLEVSSCPLDSCRVIHRRGTSISLTWEHLPASSPQVVIEYGPEGFEMGTGTAISTSSTYIDIPNLQPETSYDFVIYRPCGGEACGNIRLRTRTVTQDYQIPFCEDFEQIDRHAWDVDWYSRESYSNCPQTDGSYSWTHSQALEMVAFENGGTVIILPDIIYSQDNNILSFWAFSYAPQSYIEVVRMEEVDWNLPYFSIDTIPLMGQGRWHHYTYSIPDSIEFRLGLRYFHNIPNSLYRVWIDNIQMQRGGYSIAELSNVGPTVVTLTTQMIGTTDSLSIMLVGGGDTIYRYFTNGSDTIGGLTPGTYYECYILPIGPDEACLDYLGYFITPSWGSGYWINCQTFDGLISSELPYMWSFDSTDAWEIINTDLGSSLAVSIDASTSLTAAMPYMDAPHGVLSFAAKATSADSYIIVDTPDSITVSTDYIITQMQHTSTLDTLLLDTSKWTYFSIPLNGLSSWGHYITFTAGTASANGSVIIDKVGISDCPMVHFTMDGTTLICTSEDNSNIDYLLQYTDGVDTGIYHIVGSPFHINNLNMGTDYTLTWWCPYLDSGCAPQITVRTSDLLKLPYCDQFQNDGNNIPATWTFIKAPNNQIYYDYWNTSIHYNSNDNEWIYTLLPMAETTTNLSIWANVHSLGADYIQIGVLSVPTDTGSFIPIASTPHDGWVTLKADLHNHIGKRIAFRTRGDAHLGDLFIAGVPLAHFSLINARTIKIWTEHGGDFDLYIRSDNTACNSGDTIIHITDSIYYLSDTCFGTTQRDSRFYVRQYIDSAHIDCAADEQLSLSSSYPLPYCYQFHSEWDRDSYLPWEYRTYNAHNHNTPQIKTIGGESALHLDCSQSQYVIFPEMEIDSMRHANLRLVGYSQTNHDSIIIGIMTDAYDTSSFNAIDTLVGATEWETYIVDFTDYTDNGRWIAIRTSCHPNGGWFRIDQISVESCPYALGATASLYRHNVIKIDNPDTLHRGTFFVEYGLHEFTQGTGTTIRIDSLPTLLTLSHETDYDFYFHCDSSSISCVPAQIITTGCPPLPVPSCIDFDTNNLNDIPHCWITRNNDIIVSDIISHSGTQSLTIPTNQKRIIISSPDIDIDSLQHLSISLWVYSETPGDRLIIGTMANPYDNATFHPIRTLIPNESGIWQRFLLDFSSAAEDAHFIGIRAVGTPDSRIYIDDIYLSSCGAHGLRAINVSGDSITIDWSQVGNPSITISMIEDGVTSRTITGPISHPYTIHSLQPLHRYTFILNSYCSPDSLFCNSNFTDTIAIVTPTEAVGCVNPTDLHSQQALFFSGSFGNPYAHDGAIDFGSNSPDSRHTVHYDTAERDPRTNNMLHTVPSGHTSSVRLGNWNTNNLSPEAEGVTYSLFVDTMSFNIILLSYAAVLQNPMHNYADQPRFRLELLDSNMHIINPDCAAADFVADRNLEWNEAPDNVLWRDWTSVGIDLSEYAGQNVFLRLTTFDCNEGSHYGYAYFTLKCLRKELTTDRCGDIDSITFSAPEGFSYRWYTSANDSSISTASSITVPSSNTIYYCDISFVDNPNCKFTLNAYAGTRYPLARMDTSSIFANCALNVNFTNNSVISADGINPLPGHETCEFAHWDFGNGLSSDDYHGSTSYLSSGSYEVTLIVGIAGGQCTDTLRRTLTLDIPSGRAFDTIEGCDSIIWHSNTYTTSGSYSDTLPFTNQAGCDSITTLDLTITHPDTTIIVDTISMSELPYRYQEHTFYSPVDTILLYPQSSGCTNVTILTLHVSNQITQYICENLLPYTWFGHVFEHSDSIVVIEPQTNGGSLIQTLFLFVNPNYDVSDSIIICPGLPFIYGETDYGGPVTLDTLLTTMYGCDSLVHVTLYERDSSYRVTTLYSFDSIEWFVIDSTLAVCAPTTLYLRDSTDGSVSRLWSIRTPDTTFTSDDSLVVVRLMNGYDNMVASIQVTVMSAEGCIDTVEYPLYIFSSPKADFYWDPYIPARHNPEVQFFNRSEPDGLTYLWRIPRVAGGEYDTSTRFEPSYHWGSESDNMTGEYTVDLIAYWTHYYNDTVHVCTDTSTQTIVITDDYLQFPNLVTPDGDGNNDIWKIVNLLEYGVYPMNELWIYNAWGVLVYHVKNIQREEQFWDPVATHCPDGTYYYRFMAISEYGRIKRNGLIEVISGD